MYNTESDPKGSFVRLVALVVAFYALAVCKTRYYSIGIHHAFFFHSIWNNDNKKTAVINIVEMIKIGGKAFSIHFPDCKLSLCMNPYFNSIWSVGVLSGVTA